MSDPAPDPDLAELVERLANRLDAAEQRIRKLEQAERVRDRSERLERAQALPTTRRPLPLRPLRKG